MKIAMILAHGVNGELGFNNQLLWHIPDDLKQFKELTNGYPIIMGRKTFESLPGLLPNRKHIVISNTNIGHTPEVSYYNSLTKAINQCANNSGINKIFIIGGASIYKQALELDLVDELYVSEVNYQGIADAFIKPIDYSNWDLIKSEHHPVDISGGIQIPSWTFNVWYKLKESNE